jgi:MFS family permease
MNAQATALPMTGPRVPLSSWLALATLVALELALLVDRELLVLLTDPIKQSLSASDLQVGLLQGVGVGVVGAAVGYPLGWLADRHDRRVVLAGCVSVWALALLASAWAPTFAVLFIAGSLSTVGFAGLMPVSFSIIPTLFTGAYRQLANSVVSIAGNMGRGIVVLACGLVIQSVDPWRVHLPAALQHLDTWRLALLTAALPAPLMLWLVSRLPRAAGRADVLAESGSAGGRADAGKTASPPPVGMIAFIGQHRRAFAGLFGGMTLAVLSFSPVFVWMPVSVMRQFGDTPAQTAAALGTASILAALAGVLVATLVLPRLQRLLGDAMPITVVLASCGVAVFTTLALLAAGNALQTYVAMGLQMAFMMAAIMVFPTLLQDIAPAALRGRMASLLGVVTTVGSAGGPPLVGALSDHLAHRTDGLLLSVVGLGTVGFALAGLLLAWARGAIAQAVAAARRIDSGQGLPAVSLA